MSETGAEMPDFPSIEWFEATRHLANSDPALGALGSCDASVGVKVGEQVFRVVFEGFQCAAVAEVDDDALHDVDFYLEMPSPRWQALIENIHANGAADADHTLNSLDLSEPEPIVKSHDAFGFNRFSQYHLTVQKYFDAAAGLDTSF
jgi:hypothetical protein